MASHEKCNRTKAVNLIRHIERDIKNSSNKDIDKNRTSLNYSLLKDGRTAMERYQKRLKEVYVYGRRDTITLVGIVLTAPSDITDPKQQVEFFGTAAQFMADLYGHKNICTATVHMDEAGRSADGAKIKPHLHLTFLPVVPKGDTHPNSTFEEKVCCNDVLGKHTKHHENFHKNLQEYLDKNLSFKARVINGAVAANGRNYSVAEIKRGDLKRDREIERTHNFEVYHGR